MDLNNARTLAREEMDRHGLTDWTLDISVQMSKCFGKCLPVLKTIRLSASLIVLNSEQQVLDTTRREIAHALREQERPLSRLTAAQWHDDRWKQICRQIGARPEQFYKLSGANAVRPARTLIQRKPWIRVCPRCGFKGLPATIRQKNLGHAGCNVVWNYPK